MKGLSWNPGPALAVVVSFPLTHLLSSLPLTLSLSLNNVCQKWTTPGSLLQPSHWTIRKWPPLSMALSCCDLTAIKCQVKLMDSYCQSAEAYITQWIIVMEWMMSWLCCAQCCSSSFCPRKIFLIISVCVFDDVMSLIHYSFAQICWENRIKHWVQNREHIQIYYFVIY